MVIFNPIKFVAVTHQKWGGQCGGKKIYRCAAGVFFDFLIDHLSRAKPGGAFGYMNRYHNSHIKLYSTISLILVKPALGAPIPYHTIPPICSS